MRRLFALVLVVTWFAPLSVSAADAITRRDGFVMLWSAISRPTDPWKKDAFDDVPKGDVGYDEITFAHGRGLLDDTIAADKNEFRPNDPLLLKDALLWLVRTRNVALPELLTPATLTGTLALYNMKLDPKLFNQPVTSDKLLDTMRTFDANFSSHVFLASNYGEELQGAGTAFGETFDWHQMTAAHRTFPYNTLVKVTNVANGMSVVVRINDRGPYVDGRSLDLSTGAFMAIAPDDSGVIEVNMQRLGDASLVGPCVQEERMTRRVAPGVILSPGIPHILRLGQLLQVQSKQWFVLRTVKYPDGTIESFQDWVKPGEQFKLKPSAVGNYVFTVGATDGRQRTINMDVADCSDSPGA